MKRSFLFTALFFSVYTYGQTSLRPLSAFYSSINAYSSQFCDAFSFQSNAAALAGVKDVAAGVYSERRFMLQGLSSHTLAVALPTTKGSFGFRGAYTGNTRLSETMLGFGYARKLGGKADVGLQFNYLLLKAGSYGAVSTLTYSAGAIFHLTEQLQTGFSVYNPVAMQFGKEGTEKLTAIYSVGMGYDVSPQVYIGGEIQKEENHPLSFNAGVHYVVAEKLSARVGFSSATSVYCTGFGVQLKKIRLEATASVHPYLGLTPGLLLIYSSAK